MKLSSVTQREKICAIILYTLQESGPLGAREISRELYRYAIRFTPMQVASLMRMEPGVKEYIEGKRFRTEHWDGLLYSLKKDDGGREPE